MDEYRMLQIFQELGVALVAGALLSVLGGVLSRKRTRKGDTASRAEQLTRSLREATDLIDSIVTEINERTKLVDKLRQDADQYDQLLKLKKPEVDAVAQVLRGELQAHGRKSFWSGVGINFVFFLLGVIVSVVITVASQHQTARSPDQSSRTIPVSNSSR